MVRASEIGAKSTPDRRSTTSLCALLNARIKADGSGASTVSKYQDFTILKMHYNHAPCPAGVAGGKFDYTCPRSYLHFVARMNPFCSRGIALGRAARGDKSSAAADKPHKESSQASAESGTREC